MQYKATSQTPGFPLRKMAAPVAIGTRGTVGSLLKKEIEYFTKFELEGRGGAPGNYLMDRLWKWNAQLITQGLVSGY